MFITTAVTFYDHMSYVLSQATVTTVILTDENISSTVRVLWSADQI